MTRIIAQNFLVKVVRFKNDKPPEVTYMGKVKNEQHSTERLMYYTVFYDTYTTREEARKAMEKAKNYGENDL